jgi:hypothetical protein
MDRNATINSWILNLSAMYLSSFRNGLIKQKEQSRTAKGPLWHKRFARSHLYIINIITSPLSL